MANTGAKLLAGALLALSWAHVVAADDAVVVGGEGNHCGEDRIIRGSTRCWTS